MDRRRRSRHDLRCLPCGAPPLRRATGSFDGFPVFRPAPIILVGEEMLDRSQQIRAEPAARPLEPLQTVRFKQPGEERVREVPGVVATGTVAPDERFHGAIVCFAQVAKRLPGFRRLAAAREDLGPARCVERICATIVHESTSLFQACTRGLL